MTDAPLPSRPTRRGLHALVLALALGTPAGADELPETVRPAGPQTVARPESTTSAPSPLSGGESWFQRDMRRADSLLVARGGVRADSARLLLRWNAPAGSPRAQELKLHRCSTRDSADTLYLSFVPGRTSPGFNGFTATLRFRSAAGDTLSPWWHFEREGAHAGALQCQFDPSPEFPGERPWDHTGVGHVSYRRTPDVATLRLVYAVPAAQAKPLESSTAYVLGRVIFRRGAAPPGCEKPVCLEWEDATLAFALKDEPRVQQGERFVAWNSPDGSVCEALRGGRRPGVWRPGTR